MTTPDAQINTLVEEAYSALTAAEEIANEYKIEFSFNPAYGMGGWFVPEPYTKSEAIALLESGKTLSEEQKEYVEAALAGDDDDDYYDEEEYGWRSSSSNC